MDAPPETGARTRTVPVLIETADLSCDGLIHVRTGGYRTRISDVLNEPSPFIVVTEVTVRREQLDDGEPESTYYDTIILRKGEIKYVIPLD